RRVVAVRTMQHLRAQRRAACQPTVSARDRRAIRGPACRYDRVLGSGGPRSAPNKGAVTCLARGGRVAIRTAGWLLQGASASTFSRGRLGLVIVHRPRALTFP